MIEEVVPLIKHTFFRQHGGIPTESDNMKPPVSKYYSIIQIIHLVPIYNILSYNTTVGQYLFSQPIVLTTKDTKSTKNIIGQNA